MKFTVTIEGKKSIEAIQKEFADKLSPKEIQKTTAFALNETGKRVGSMINKPIKEEYTTNAKYRKRIAKVTKMAAGQPNRLYTEVSYNYGTIPMVGFKYKDNSKGKNKTAGVTVEIKKGKNKILKHAFVATMKSGHKGIFAAGKYGAKGFIHERIKTTNNKQKITELKTASPFTMATNKAIESKTTATITEQLPKRVRALLQIKVDKLTKL